MDFLFKVCAFQVFPVRIGWISMFFPLSSFVLVFNLSDKRLSGYGLLKRRVLLLEVAIRLLVCPLVIRSCICIEIIVL